MEEVPFRASGQRITLLLLAFVCDLLALGQTLKAVSLMTGLNRNVVKKIDKKRLSGLYTGGDEDGKTRLRKPKRQARYLGADKFKLYGGHRYATVIIDLKTGHALSLAYSKKRQVVHDFCDFVGSEWMSHVEAIACDMNADFERAFLKRHPHLDIVYEYFHLIKNFNEKVICKVRKDGRQGLRRGETARLQGPSSAPHTSLSPVRTPARGRTGMPSLVLQKGGARKRYEELISQNELLAACDIVDEMLTQAYSCTDADAIRAAMERIVDTCRCTKDRHFEWFARLVEGHREGIVAHMRHHISSGRVESTNCMIKTLRRAG
jgi:transposase